MVPVSGFDPMDQAGFFSRYARLCTALQKRILEVAFFGILWRFDQVISSVRLLVASSDGSDGGHIEPNR